MVLEFTKLILLFDVSLKDLNVLFCNVQAAKLN